MKKMYKKNNKCKKILFAIISVIVTAFIIYNIFWVTYVKTIYGAFTENIPEDKGSILISLDDFSYSVKKPSYLSLTGNLSLIDEKTSDGLIIWPSPIYQNEYAVIITTDVTEVDGREIPHQCVISIDENGQWADYSNVFGEKEKMILNERKSDIQMWLKMADDMWNLY